MQVVLSVLTGQIQNAEQGESLGYGQQWQRALEKAYFEKQVEAMRSTGPSEVDNGGEDHFSGKTQLQDMEDNESGKEIFVDSPTQTEHSFKTQASSLDLAVSLSVGKDLPAVSTRSPVAFPAHLLTQSLIPEPDTIEASEFCREMSVLIKSALPSASSVKVFTVEDGLHVVIRDVSMNGDRLKKLLPKIRSLLWCANRRLITVTLNGEQIWESQNQVSVGTKDQTINPGIDHIYY